MVLIVLMGGMASAVRAEPLSQQRQVEITYPEVNAEVRGLVEIRGSATVSGFQFYKIEFGVGPSPSQWAIIGGMREQPLINGQLGIWDTTQIPDGVYSLRLQAVKADGNYEEFYVRQISVVNSRPTATPQPSPSNTPAVTPTEYNTPTPTATATPQIIGPDTELSLPTATPTLSRPTTREALPIDPEGWGEAFAFGAAAMGIVFVLLGIVFGIRRLL
jgi:hypothetical protein